jgi:superfamily II DNA/RNA helicase
LSTSFADLGVPAEAVSDLRARGLTEAFPIQVQAIPPALAGQDVCGKAPTGSGKTIAFGIPVALRVGRGAPGRPQALILAPTRELAAQIEQELVLLLGRHGRRRVASFYGGVGFGPQLAALRKGIDVAVACPGRLVDLVKRGSLSLQDVSIAVIDEADRMADMGFLPEVKRILDAVRPDRQTLLFSATLDGEVDVLIKRYQNSPVRVAVATDNSQSERTEHVWIDARREDRLSLAVDYIAKHGSTIVFCRTKHGTDRVAQQLSAAGIKAVPIHGGRSQAQRDRALAAFSAGKAQAMVATDVAARGIHVDNVACVLHFDIAGTDKDYLHRSGRTGRAGADGLVISFVTQNDGSAVRSLQKALAHPVSPKWGSRGLASPSGVTFAPEKAPEASTLLAPRLDHNGQRPARSGGPKPKHGQGGGAKGGYSGQGSQGGQGGRGAFNQGSRPGRPGGPGRRRRSAA